MSYNNRLNNKNSKFKNRNWRSNPIGIGPMTLNKRYRHMNLKYSH